MKVPKSHIQEKIMRIEGKRTYYKEKKTIKSDLKLTQMLELPSKCIQIVIITSFYIFKKLEI